MVVLADAAHLDCHTFHCPECGGEDVELQVLRDNQHKVVFDLTEDKLLVGADVTCGTCLGAGKSELQLLYVDFVESTYKQQLLS